MKRLLACMLVMILALVSCTALADTETPTFSASETNEKIKNLDKIDRQDAISNYSPTRVDSVSLNNDVYTVSTGKLTYRLDMRYFPGFLCITQDKYVSFMGYLYLKDPNAYQKFMIENNIHFNIYEPETQLDIYIYDEDGDELSERIGDLRLLPEDTIATIATFFGSDSYLVKVDNEYWMLYPEYQHLLNIRGGRYIHVEYGGTNDPDGDLDDTLNILSCMTIR